MEHTKTTSSHAGNGNANLEERKLFEVALEGRHHEEPPKVIM
jgi:hypothetical protein